MSMLTTWTGISDHHWQEPLNWTNGIPSAGLHAHIPAQPEGGKMPEIRTAVAIDFTLKNDGEIYCSSSFCIEANGILQNIGQLHIQPTGTLQNKGTIMNEGRLINEGTLDNARIISNRGMINNEGLLDNENVLINFSTLLNTGVIDNHYLITNTGNLENFNIIEHYGEGKVDNEGLFPEEMPEEPNTTKAPFSLLNEQLQEQNAI